LTGIASSREAPVVEISHRRDLWLQFLTGSRDALSIFRLMSSRGESSNSQGAAIDETGRALPVRPWWWKPGLLLLSVVLLTLSFAPFGQFYLAWVAMVPWLIVLRHCRSARGAFFWSWLGGVVFFSLNMWWLAYVTGPGMAALILWLGVYWGVAGAIIYGAGLLQLGRGNIRPAPASRAAPDGGTSQRRPPIISALLIAAVWVGLEWLRAVWPLGGLEWQFIGHTQSPLLHLCQVADVTGVFGISFWLMLVNAWIALLLLHRDRRRELIPSGITVGLILIGVAGYGFFRFAQHATRPGPQVVVIQPNYPQSNSGDKGADLQDILIFHIKQTQRALAANPQTDLVAWSETMMPPLNASALERFPTGSLPEAAKERIESLAAEYGTSLIVGGMYQGGWVREALGWKETESRNSAYFFQPGGAMSQLRYDKIHLVPFGEYLPFHHTIPPLYRLLLWLSPYKEGYFLNAGAPDALTVFELTPHALSPGRDSADRATWRFVTPICFEDMDAELVRRMFKPQAGGRKRADFIVNLTNDGWFKYNEMPEHLQQAIFRSIENRVPTARSVNTGVSGFVDSMGRTSNLLPVDTEGVSTNRLALDDRVTFYTRFGDVFGVACALVAGLLATVGAGRWWLRRRAAGIDNLQGR
jgi:apolipoprotein N-acyltransferase